MSNLFQVNNKDTRATSVTSISIFIVNFERTSLLTDWCFNCSIWMSKPQLDTLGYWIGVPPLINFLKLLNTTCSLCHSAFPEAYQMHICLHITKISYPTIFYEKLLKNATEMLYKCEVYYFTVNEIALNIFRKFRNTLERTIVFRSKRYWGNGVGATKQTI